MNGKNIFNSMGNISQDTVDEAAEEYKSPQKWLICRISAAAASIVLIIGIVLITVHLKPFCFNKEIVPETSQQGWTVAMDEVYTGGPIETVIYNGGGPGDVEYVLNDVTHIGRKYIWELPRDAEYVDTVKVYRQYYGYVEAYIYSADSTPEVLYWKWNADSVDETWGKVWDRVWILEDEKVYE